MKTIVIVFGGDKNGGAEQVLKNLATYLFDKGYKVIAVSAFPRQQGFWDDFNGKIFYTSAKFKHFNPIHLTQILFRLSRTENIDITISSFVFLNGILAVLKKIKILKTKKIIARESTNIFERSDLKNKFLFDFFFHGYRFSDLIICQTKQMQQQFLQHIKFVDEKKVVVIPNPIYLEKINALANEVENEISTFGKYIVGCGRLKNYKGFDVLISAYLQNKNLQQYNLVIVGDGSQKVLLQQLAGNLLNQKIFFVGYKNNPLPYFKHAAVCVLCSLHEGFPNTLLQMMVLNNAVVSTLCADGIENIKGIFTCEINDVKSLSTALENCISQPLKANNRATFDDYLQQRGFEKFMQQIFEQLKIDAH